MIGSSSCRPSDILPTTPNYRPASIAAHSAATVVSGGTSPFEKGMPAGRSPGGRLPTSPTRVFPGWCPPVDGALAAGSFDHS